MDVVLATVNAPPNKINKSLSDSVTISNVKFTEHGTLDVLNPSILINYTEDIGDINRFNYMRIGKLKRYYFIDSISTEGGLIRIDGRVDVLKSYSADILDSTQYIIRSESINNKYVVDPLLPITSRKKYYIKNFGNPVYDEECTSVILETIGKGVS